MKDSANSPLKLGRALVLPGGIFQIPLGVGVFDALTESGRAPDIILTSCGFSLAAALINAIPDARERMDFMLSEEFQDLLFLPKFRYEHFAPILPQLANMLLNNLALDRTPRLFTDTLFYDHAQIPLKPLERPFSSRETRALMLGARLNLEKEEQGRPRKGKAVYREIVMTDPETALLLKRQARMTESSIARLLQGTRFENLVEKEISVIDDLSLQEAVRVAVSDPFVFPPIRRGGEHFMSGVMNAYPIEIAKALANEIVFAYPGKYGALQDLVIRGAFRYSNEARRRNVIEQGADIWVDLSDASDIYQKHGFFDLNVKFSMNPFKDFGKIIRNITTDREAIREKTRQLHRIGRERTLEGLEAGRGALGHIRFR